MFEETQQGQGDQTADAAQAPLFKNYEIKSWKLSPRIYKILAASLVFNLVAIIVAGQSNLLTRKGCDSPLVGSVCQVLDVVYLGSDVLGTQTQYVDGSSTHIDLGDSEITYLDLTGQDPPLTYPAGYFAIANPEQFQQFEPIATAPTQLDQSGFPTNIPGISNPIPSAGAMRPQVTPTPNKNAVPSDLPDEDDNTAGDSTVAVRPGGGVKGMGQLSKGGKKPKNNTPPPTDPTATAGVETDANGNLIIQIDRDPLRKLGSDVRGMVERKEVNLGAQFIVTATGKLNKDGKIEETDFKYTRRESADPKMIEVVQRALMAVNDSGYLKYLANLSGKNISLEIGQDDNFMIGTVISEVESPLRASSLKTAFRLMIAAKVNEKLTSDKPDDKDDIAILNTATVDTDGKKVIIKFAVPKAVAQELIQRKLIDNSAAQEPTKPSGDVQNKNTNPTAVK